MNPRHTILAVDDDAVSRKMLSVLVEQEGYAVSTAAGGADALRILAEQHIDAVLLDIVLPGVDGMAVLRSIKCDSHLCHLPVIVISAVDDRASILRCVEMGAEDYLLKPFDPLM